MKYDLIIVGGGPGGLSAAIYAYRYRLKTLVLSETIGGMAGSAHKICNFPSYVEIGGMELIQKFIKHLESLGGNIVYESVNLINKKGDEFIVKTNKNEYSGKKIIFAGGTKRRNLNIKGEKEFLGRGVSYCATCDAAFFKNKKVSVIGGSDSALTSALLLAEYCSEVNIIYRKDKFFRAEPIWVELVKKQKNIKVLFNEEVKEIYGTKIVEGIKLKSGKKLELNGIFIEIGSIPNLDIISNLNIKTDRGYIITNKNQTTNIKGFYAVGDITNCELKQIITASAQGAIAAFSIYEEIKKEE